MKKIFTAFFACLLILSGIFINFTNTQVEAVDSSCLCACTKTVSPGTKTCFFPQTANEAACRKTCTDNGMTFLACDSSKPTEGTMSCVENTDSSDSSNEQVSFANPVPALSGKSVPDLVGLIIKSLLGIIGAMALVIFIYAGFVWMTAQGNSTKIQKAREIMTYATIGLIVIFGSYVLLRFVFDIIK